MHSHIIHFIFLCCLLVTRAHAAPAEATNLEQLRADIEKIVVDEKIPGVQVALFNQDQVFWSQAFGKSDLENHQPLQTSHLMRAGSTTKTLTALAVVQLARQGRFSLDDPLAKVAPQIQFSNPWEASDPVRIIHLLEHTAGFDDMHFRNFYNKSEPGISILDAVNRDASALVSRWKPGTRHAYSNPGYGILGHIIEQYSGIPFEDYLEQNWLKPLAMSLSTLSTAKANQKSSSKGYVDETPASQYDIYLRSAGILYTTAEELAAVGRFLLSEGRSASIANIDASVIKQMETVQTTDAVRAGLAYGYATGIYHASRSSHLWYGHNGGIDGFSTSYGYSRELNLGYVVIMNSSSVFMRPLLNAITGYLTRDLPKNLAASDQPIPEAIDGYYRLANDRNQIFAGVSYVFAVAKISRESNSLLVSPLMGNDSTLSYQGNNQFQEENYATPNAIFLANTEQGDVFEIDGQYFVKTSIWSAWTPLILIGLVVVTLLLVLLYFPVWAINWMRGKLAGKQAILLRAIPLVAASAFALAVFGLMNVSLISIGDITWQALLIRFAPIVFALLGLIGMVYSWHCRQLVSHAIVSRFSLSISVAVVAFSSYLYYWDYLGLALWAW